MCLYTRYIRNKKYIANKKNGGIVPAINDYRVMAVPVKCGECMECKKQRTNEWRVRLSEEIKSDQRGWFVTLTFDQEHLIELANDEKIKHLKGYALDNAIAKLATRRFYERHRKQYGKTIKKWLVTEIGGKNTERIHMHGIIWNDLSPERIAEIWHYGKVKDGKYNPKGYKQSYLNQRTINYITKYITKKDIMHVGYKPIVLYSNGLGGDYVNQREAEYNKYIKGRTFENYVMQSGHELQMPIYLRNKIYTEEEREKLWIEKLDKGIMYIGGRKINVANGYEEYDQYLQEAQRENERKGYGNGDFKWDIIKHDEERRILKQKANWEEMGMKWEGRTVQQYNEASLNATTPL